jgi:hypothetical protein
MTTTQRRRTRARARAVRLAPLVWAVVGPLHRTVAPLLLTRAAGG